MSFRGLLIGIALLAVLSGAMYWSEKAKKAEEGKPSPDAAPKLLTFADDQVKQVEMRHKDGAATRIQKDASNKWQITAPQTLPADQDAANSVVTALTGLTWDRLVEEKATDLASYGLTSPPTRVIATFKDGKTRTLLIGDETPTSGGNYAKLEGDPRVFTVASYTKSNLDKTYKDLRDKRLLTFDSDKLTRVDLAAKGEPVQFGKNNANEWQILQPRPFRADNNSVEELVRKLKDAKMDTSISDEDAKKAVASFNNGTKVALAKVTDSSGTQQIEVKKAAKENEYFAKSSVVEGIHKVGTDLGEGLAKGLDDFRNKKLFDFGFDEPTKVEVRDGTKTYSFQKSGDKWTAAGGKQMDSTSVQNLVDKLRDLASIKFVETGFTTPELEITVTSKDGKRVEKLLISKSGNSYLAKRDNEPAIYELDSARVTEIKTAASEVKEPQPAKPAAKK